MKPNQIIEFKVGDIVVYPHRKGFWRVVDVFNKQYYDHQDVFDEKGVRRQYVDEEILPGDLKFNTLKLVKYCTVDGKILKGKVPITVSNNRYTSICYAKNHLEDLKAKQDQLLKLLDENLNTI